MERVKTHPIFIAAGAAVLLFSLLGAAALTGMLPAASPKPGDPVPVAQSPAAQPRGKAAAPCVNCGVIDAIRVVQVQGEASGVGAVAGGVAGAVVGNQFGHGAANTLLTLGGAAGGAYAGNTIEKHVKTHTSWRVTVRLEDGTVRTLSQPAQPPFAVGDHVRIVNSTIERA
jgi:outer membrane lipoprotein SlyB